MAEHEFSAEGFGEAVVFLLIFLGIIAFFGVSLNLLMTIARKGFRKIKWEPNKTKFRTEHGYGYDLVMVMPIYGADDKLSEFQKKYSHEYVVEQLTKSKIETALFYSVQQDDLFIKMRMSPTLLKNHASKSGYKMQLHKLNVEKRLMQGCKSNDGAWKEGDKNPETGLPIERPEGGWLWLPVGSRKNEDGSWGRGIVDVKKQSKYLPTEYIYGKYSINPDFQDIYHNDSLENQRIFRGVDRIKLMMDIIASKETEDGAELSFARMKAEGALTAFFPIHDYEELWQLETAWIRMFQWPWHMPLVHIRDYLGEKISLYFAWLGLYTTFLAGAAVAGMIAWLNVAFEGDNKNAVLIPYFAAFMAVWSTAFLEQWKRKEKNLAMKWGMFGFEDEEQVRVEFEGEIKASLIDGHEELYFPDEDRWPLMCASQSYIWTLALGVIGQCVCIMIIQYYITGGYGEKNTINPMIGTYHLGPIFAQLLNAVFIMFWGDNFTPIAIRLTEKENHRTQTQFEDSLIAKSFVFNFVNAYASLFYVAFFSSIFANMSSEDNAKYFQCNTYQGETESPDCMEAMNSMLGTIFCVRLILGNIMEVGGPVWKNYKSEQENQVTAEERQILQKSIEATMSVQHAVFDPHSVQQIQRMDHALSMTAIEEQYVLDEYDTTLDLFNDYLEMVIQFGYATLFSCSFTLAPVMAYVNNYVELRVDAWKICTQSRRPLPSGAEDIGTWQSILELMSVLAITTNLGIVCFTSDKLVTASRAYRTVWFIIIEHIAIGAKLIAAAVVPDIPDDVQIQLERQQLIVDKIIDGKKDEMSEILEYENDMDDGDRVEEKEPPTFPELTVYPTDREWKEVPKPKTLFSDGE